MGLDPGHMPHGRMAKALPPAYMEYVTGQLAMHTLRVRYGVRTRSYTEMLADPPRCHRELRLLRRGAGGQSPSLGLKLEPARSGPEPSRGRGGPRSLAEEEGLVEPVGAVSRACDSSWQVGDLAWYIPREGSPSQVRVAQVDEASRAAGEELCVTVRELSGAGGERSTTARRVARSCPAPTDPSALAPAKWSLTESDFRELDYTYAGDFDSCWLPPERADWLEPIRDHVRVAEPLRPEAWVGRNTFVHVPMKPLLAALPAIGEALGREHSDTRVSVLVSSSDLEASLLSGRLAAAGFEHVHKVAASATHVIGWDGEQLRLPHDLHLYSAGVRECRAEGAWLDHASLYPEMDPRDCGGYTGPPGRKAAIAWTPVLHDATRWRGKGLPPEVEEMMVSGAVVGPIGGSDQEPWVFEESQYPWIDSEHFFRDKRTAVTRMV